MSDDRPSPSRPALLIQEWQKGEEHALNVINDLEGAHVATLAMRKLGMRAGETDRAVTVADPRLASLGQRIGAALRHVGNLDVDIIVAGDRSWILDLNPRFGGSYPFAHAAGANLPAALLALAQGLTPNPQDLRLTPGITSAKLPTITAKPQPDDRPDHA